MPSVRPIAKKRSISKFPCLGKKEFWGTEGKKLHKIIWALLFRQWVVHLLSGVWLFVTLWAVARQASLSFTISQSLLKLMSIELVMLWLEKTFKYEMLKKAWKHFSKEVRKIIRFMPKIPLARGKLRMETWPVYCNSWEERTFNWDVDRTIYAIQHLSSSGWLISLSMRPSRFILVVSSVWIYPSFKTIIFLCGGVCVIFSLFICQWALRLFLYLHYCELRIQWVW